MEIANSKFVNPIYGAGVLGGCVRTDKIKDYTLRYCIVTDYMKKLEGV